MDLRNGAEARTAIDGILDEIAKADVDVGSLEAVGHRVVHGGPRFVRTTRIDDDALQGLRELAPLAPLHNPVAVELIVAARTALPAVPHFAAFDTAFHATLPR